MYFKIFHCTEPNTRTDHPISLFMKNAGCLVVSDGLTGLHDKELNLVNPLGPV